MVRILRAISDGVLQSVALKGILSIGNIQENLPLIQYRVL